MPYMTQQPIGPQALPSATGVPMYQIGGQPQQHAALPPAQQSPAIAAPPPQDAYKDAMVSQLAQIGQQQGQTPIPAAGATGAGGEMNAMAHVVGSVVNAYKQKQDRNFMLNNVGGGQQGWDTTVTPGV